MESINPVAIGQKLQDLRGKKTIVETAEAVGISPSALSMYESGQRIPRDNVKIRLANYFNVKVSDLFFC